MGTGLEGLIGGAGARAVLQGLWPALGKLTPGGEKRPSQNTEQVQVAGQGLCPRLVEVTRMASGSEGLSHWSRFRKVSDPADGMA